MHETAARKSGSCGESLDHCRAVKNPRGFIALSEKRKQTRLLISVVMPAYNEGGNVSAMHEALSVIASDCPSFDWEFVFVDDGSTDDTFELLEQANSIDSRVKVIRLSRNYGSHIGAAAGLRFASGNAALIMAADLQDHPREIPRLVEKWREGFDVVWAIRSQRSDDKLDIFLSHAFAALIRQVALPNYPKAGTVGFCLIDRKVIDSLNRFPERNRMIFGLILYSGFRQTYLTYERQERHSGHSKWRFRSKVKLTLDTVLSFSAMPLRVAALSGIIAAVVGLCFASYLAIDRLVEHESTVPGWTSIIVIALILSGLQLTILGMLGEYLWRALDDARQRPIFLVQSLVGHFDILDESTSAAMRSGPSAALPIAEAHNGTPNA
jgi:polyisoprenyl-phosphate glycosyltransferase